jgi:hypothetical protein
MDLFGDLLAYLGTVIFLTYALVRVILATANRGQPWDEMVNGFGGAFVILGHGLSGHAGEVVREFGLALLLLVPLWSVVKHAARTRVLS